MKDELVHLHSEAVYEMLDEFLVGHLDITGLDSRTKIETNINSAVGENDRLLPTDLVADKKRNFLDLTQPLFWQLWNGNYSKAFYLEQVHIPRHVSGSARIFGSPYMEVFTKTPWYIIPIVWLPVVTYNVLQSLNLSLGFDKVFVYFLAGIALWSLVEYTIHRFLFHLDDVLPDSS
ncbi:fatty acid alpha-hydroxylase, partial [Haplosporangium sp. Z 27]